MSNRMKAKHQRLVLLAIAIVALLAAALVAIWVLRNQASYFYVPSDVAANPPVPGQAVRLGGMVQTGSVKTQADGITIDFIVGDGETTVPVRYAGILPDLFTEGSGVVAEGRFDSGGRFVADNLLAKHDENYIPKEVVDALKAQGEWRPEAGGQ